MCKIVPLSQELEFYLWETVSPLVHPQRSPEWGKSNTKPWNHSPGSLLLTNVEDTSFPYLLTIAFLAMLFSLHVANQYLQFIQEEKQWSSY